MEDSSLDPHLLALAGPVLPYHEMGHQIQVSILGDLGISAVAVGDWIYRLLTLDWEDMEKPVAVTLEPWAEDFGASMSESH
jgi:hypothetical protein